MVPLILVVGEVPNIRSQTLDFEFEIQIKFFFQYKKTPAPVSSLCFLPFSTHVLGRILLTCALIYFTSIRSFHCWKFKKKYCFLTKLKQYIMYNEEYVNEKPIAKIFSVRLFNE